MLPNASQETQTLNLFKRREIFWTCEKKARQIIWVYTLINNFRWSNSSIKIILIHIFSGLNLLQTQPWLNQETKIMIYADKRQVNIEIMWSIFDQLRARISYSEWRLNMIFSRLVTDRLKSLDRFYSERRLLIKTILIFNNNFEPRYCILNEIDKWLNPRMRWLTSNPLMRFDSLPLVSYYL